MKTLIATAILLLSSPAIAAPPANGEFYDPESPVKEGIFLTTSFFDGKVAFGFFTTDWECEDVVEVELECYSHRAWYVSDLNVMFLGESKGVLSTTIDDVIFTVGTYTLREQGGGYTLKVVASFGTPLEIDNRIYDPDGFNFTTCIVSPDPACGVTAD